MNSFLDLIKQRDVRKFSSKPLASLGYLNFAKSLFIASRESGYDKKVFPRFLMQALFQGLGDRKAVVTESGMLSFTDLETRAVKLANGFYKQGVIENDRVAVLLDNEQAWFETMLACMLTGIKMPMLSTHLNQVELKNCINACAPKVLVFSHRLIDDIKQIEKELTSVELFVCASDAMVSEPYTSLDTVISSAEYILPPGGFGVAQMPFSGGSSGVPKFIQQKDDQSALNQRMKGVTKRDLRALKQRFVYGLTSLGLGGIKGNIVSLVPGPLYHSGVQAAVAPLYLGGTVVVMKKFDAEQFLQTIEKEGANFTFVAPTMLERILKLPEKTRRKYNLSSMKVVVCAAAPCPDYVKVKINALFMEQGAEVNVFTEYYGSSEALMISILRPRDYEEKPERYKSVGKAIVSETRIYNREEKAWCAAGEVGQVLIRNPRIYQVQAGNSGDINASFIEVDGVYWYDDGCIGYLDEDDFLYLTSRSKDMIISGGVNVFPTEIENVIKQHEDVMDVAVIKVEDLDLGEVAGALIQMVDGKVIDESELITFCKEKGLYGFKLPKHIITIDKLPKNDAGKIRKNELEKEFFHLGQPGSAGNVKNAIGEGVD